MSITPEQLDEIEKLAEEATPDPWCVAIRGSEVTIETTGVECFVVAEMPRSGATDVQDATFIRAMREHALPLVKALREARDEVEVLGDSIGHCCAAKEGYRRERDEARAEVERLKAERDEAWGRVDNLEGVIRDNIPYSYDQGEPDEDEANPEECVEYAAKEIADLEKESERLRSALRLLWEEAQDESRCQVESGYGHLISQPCWETVTAALKEGEP